MDAKRVNWMWGVVVVLIFLALGAIAAGGLSGYALNYIPEGRFLPEIALTILLISGIIALVAILSIAAAILAALGLTTTDSAFGMPEGTIRAIIAVGLVLIFSIISIYLYGQIRDPQTDTLKGITSEQLAKLPVEKIIVSIPNQDNPELFDVKIYTSSTGSEEASQDFAKQILTTISTLVVAVAGFYFGTKAVATAKGGAEPLSLKIISPPSPVTLNSDIEKAVFRIRIQTKPAGLAVEGRVDGREDASLIQIRHDEFEYRPALLPMVPIKISFSLASDPETVKELDVKPPTQ